MTITKKSYFQIPSRGNQIASDENAADIKLLVFSSDSGDQYDELLQNILGSTSLDVETECRVFPPEVAASYTGGKLLEMYPHSSILCFGQTFEELFPQLDGLKYIIQNVMGREMVAADPLKVLAADKRKKLSLWECLKNMFH